MIDWDGVAARAYAAYAEETGDLNYLGRPMPAWGDLPERIRAAWIAAAVRVYDALRSDDLKR